MVHSSLPIPPCSMSRISLGQYTGCQHLPKTARRPKSGGYVISVVLSLEIMVLRGQMGASYGSSRGCGLVAVRSDRFRPPCAGGVSGDKRTLHIKNLNLGGHREDSKEFQK